MNNCELSDIESITFTLDTNTEMLYDGFLFIIHNGNFINIYVNGTKVLTAGDNTGSAVMSSATLAFKKGDVVKIDRANPDSAYVRYYKKRDYSNR